MPETAKQFIKKNFKDSRWQYGADDYFAPSWIKAIDRSEDGRKIQENSRAMLRWIKHYTSNSNKMSFLTGIYKYFYFKWKELPYQSEIMHYLTESSWFPSIKGYLKPSEVFLDRPELREIFGNQLPYAPKDVDEKTAELLGIRSTATSSQLLNYLKGIAQKPASQANWRVVERIYDFLSARWRPELRQEFEHESLILIRRPSPRWVSSEQALWPDLSSIFGESYVYLSTQYESRYDFFVNKVGVEREIDEEQYARAWLNMSRQKQQDPVRIKQALEKIYPVLLKVANKTPLPEWWNDYVISVRIWTQNSRFVASSEVFFPDDRDLEQLFRKKGVEFTWLPKNADSYAQYYPLYSSLGVQSLVDHVNLSAEMGIDESEIVRSTNPLLTLAAKRAVCYYLWTERDMNPEYRKLRENGILEDFLRTEEYIVPSLSVSYVLGDRISTDDESVAYWDQRKRRLYYLDPVAHERVKVEVSTILARKLAREYRKLDDFIGRLLEATDPTADAIIRKKNLSFSREDLRWLQSIMNFTHTQLPIGNLDEEPDKSIAPLIDEPITNETTAVETALEQIFGGEPPDRADSPNTESEYARNSRTRDGIHSDSSSRVIPYGSKDDRPQSRSSAYIPIIVEQDSENSILQDAKKTREYSRTDEEVIVLERVKKEDLEKFERKLEIMPYANEGYDLFTTDRDGRKFYIEVKSFLGAWTLEGFWGMTPTEFKYAKDLGSSYWLYFVEYKLDPQKFHITRIQDPFNKITRYIFPEGWRKLSEERD